MTLTLERKEAFSAVDRAVVFEIQLSISANMTMSYVDEVKRDNVFLRFQKGSLDIPLGAFHEVVI